MAKDRRKVQHIHSSVPDKQPTPASLEVGEIAVNNSNGQEFLSIKSSQDKVVRFSSDEQIVTIMERKDVMPYSGVVDNVHLDTNRSNIEIKLNQVAAGNTVKHDAVNGARDIDGDLVNPTEDGGITNGAGFAIDMSQYAMIGANPSFSSVTTTCHATLNGTTEIKGNGECGSEFNVDVADVNISADTTDIKSCDRISALTNDFQVKECTVNGKAGITSTTITNSASTINEKACTSINEETNEFNISECNEGTGVVNVNTTSINTSACTHNYNSTDDFKVTECTEGNGTVSFESCKGISAITDNFVIEQCNSGETHIHSCKGITLESKNIALTDGECGDGQITMDVNDLCLVGESKINVYGDETNVGLDCDGSQIATNSRVFGKGTLVTTKATSGAYATEYNVEIVAAQDIKEDADRDINETAGGNINETATGNINETTVNGNINENAKNINNTASSNICDTAVSAATFYGAVDTNVGINCDDTATAATTTVKGGKVIVDASNGRLGLTAIEDIIESAEGDIFITADDNICETAGDSATFYGASITKLGVNCDGTLKTPQLELGGENVCVDAEDRASVYGPNKSDIGINCGESNRSTLTRVSGNTVNVGGNIVNTDAETSVNETAPTINETASVSINEAAPVISGYATSQIVENAPQIIESASTSISETAQNIIETAGQNITETASGNIINTANGDVKTISVNNITESAEGSIVNTATGNVDTISSANITENAINKISETAKDIVESAFTSISNTAQTLNYTGNFVNITGQTLVNINADGNDSDVAVHAGDEITVYADGLLCESGKTVTIFAGNGGSLTIGGDSCNGGTGGTYPITYVRRPKKDVGCAISATTIDDALDEVYSRSRISMTSAHTEDTSSASNYSYTVYTLHQDDGQCDATINFTVNDTIVAMSAETYSASSELLKKYTLWQYVGGERKEIGEINIPKDHLLKEVSIVNGHVNGNTFTPCTDGDDTCHWYIKLVWNVFDPSTGHQDDAVTYLPADDLVKDIEEDNSNEDRGTNLKIWYDGKVNKISADTKLHFTTTTDAFDYERKNGEHYVSGTTLTFNGGAFTATTVKKYEPWSTSNTVNIPTCVSHLDRHTIKFQSGSANTFSNQTYDPGKDCANTAETINIPTCVNHLNRHMVTFQSGSTSSFGSKTYDPGMDCANTAETINIPTSIEHLNRGKLKITHNGLIDAEFDPSTSTSFTMPHSALTWTYGATSGKSGSDSFDTSVAKSINIPTGIEHLNRGKLTYSHNGFSGTFDPSANATFTSPHSALTINYGVNVGGRTSSTTYNTSAATSIDVPSCVSHLGRATLNWSYGSVNSANNGSYDPGSKCDNSSGATFIIPKTVGDVTNGVITTTDGCVNVSGDICASGVINASALYSSSDRNLKENINKLDKEDYKKVENIEFKSFNFKDDKSKTKAYGVIAQDLQSAGLDNIVHKDENNMLRVDYTSFLILKIAQMEETIKNLSDEIKNLKSDK